METVLVVEDNEEIAALLKFKLSRSGFDVVHAENGKVGLEAARANRPDIIVLDILMPVMNGLEALKHLKSDPRLMSIPVIILTALGNEKEIVDGFELGADDYVTKPFGGEEFLARVKAVLGRHKLSGGYPVPRSTIPG